MKAMIFLEEQMFSKITGINKIILEKNPISYARKVTHRSKRLFSKVRYTYFLILL